MISLRLPQFRQIASSSRLSTISPSTSPLCLPQLAGPSRIRSFSTSPITEKLKQKTHKGAAKRFKLTGSGNWKHWHAWKSHGNTPWSASHVNRLGNSALVKSKVTKKLLRRMQPYA